MISILGAVHVFRQKTTETSTSIRSTTTQLFIWTHFHYGVTADKLRVVFSASPSNYLLLFCRRQQVVMHRRRLSKVVTP